MPKQKPQAQSPRARITYLIRSLFIGKSFQHQLTDAGFERLDQARQLLWEYTRLEEHVLLILYSWEEFESFLLNTALHDYVHGIGPRDAYQDARLKSNIKVVGLLNAVTSLRDHFPTFKMLLPGFNVKKEFNKLWNDKKKSSTAFRFFERVRNYAQHQSQPVSIMESGGEWIDGHTILEDHLSLYVDVETVCNNRAIPEAEKLEYIKAYLGNCDISLLFRETVAVLGQIVLQMRGQLAKYLDAALDEYRSNLAIVQSYGTTVGKVVTLLSGTEQDSFEIFPGFVERVQRLRQTHLMIINQRHFISNRARGHKR